MKSPENGSPFKGELLPIPGIEDSDSTVRQLSTAPNKIVRQESLAYDEIAEPRDPKEFAEARKYFYHLRDAYGIAVPDIDLTLGRNEKGDKTMFMLVDKIEPAAKPDTTGKALETFYDKLIRSQIDAYLSEGAFWVDYNALQILYGHRAGEKEDKVYIIDVEPILWNPVLNKKDYLSFRGSLMNAEIEKLDKYITAAERACVPPVRFARARASLEQLRAACGEQELGMAA